MYIVIFGSTTAFLQLTNTRTSKPRMSKCMKVKTFAFSTKS